MVHQLAPNWFVKAGQMDCVFGAFAAVGDRETRGGDF
jgi:hypothetical protein